MEILHPSGICARCSIEHDHLSPVHRFDMSLCARREFMRILTLLDAGSAEALLFLTQSVNESEAQDRDIELLRQIAAGDRTAFAEFYDRHATLMFSVAAKILNDPGEAEDVLQEAFVQIWEKAGRFNPKLGRASSWAAILVRNKAIDRIHYASHDAGPRLVEEAGAVTAAIHWRRCFRQCQRIGSWP